MERLKLTSLRISEKCLQRAEKIASGQRYYKTSEVLRLAISFGLLICEKGVVCRLNWLMYESDMGRGHFEINVKWVPNVTPTEVCNTIPE